MLSSIISFIGKWSLGGAIMTCDIIYDVTVSILTFGKRMKSSWSRARLQEIIAVQMTGRKETNILHPVLKVSIPIEHQKVGVGVMT
eukprot:scaffold13693_cov114-Skeletonema_marinoi.AAC.5